MNCQRTSTDYIVTRRQARYIAKQKMKQEGKKNINRHSYSTYQTKTGYTYTVYNPSYFAKNWRDFVTWPQEEQHQKA